MSNTGRLPTEEQVRERIRGIILDLRPVRDTVPVVGDARLIEDLAFHSLALLEMAFTLEEAFQLQQIDETTGRRILTVRDVEDHVVGELRLSSRLAAAP